jgi:hypothetical protein
MSDELLKNEGEDNEVEGHSVKAGARQENDEGAEVEGHSVKAGVRQENDEGAEDVEAHLHVRSATDDDDSDDVEAHRFKA